MSRTRRTEQHTLQDLGLIRDERDRELERAARGRSCSVLVTVSLLMAAACLLQGVSASAPLLDRPALLPVRGGRKASVPGPGPAVRGGRPGPAGLVSDPGAGGRPVLHRPSDRLRRAVLPAHLPGGAGISGAVPGIPICKRKMEPHERGEVGALLPVHLHPGPAGAAGRTAVPGHGAGVHPQRPPVSASGLSRPGAAGPGAAGRGPDLYPW